MGKMIKQIANFPEGRFYMRGTRVSHYPGYKGGNSYIENLSTYSEDPVYFRGTEAIHHEGLSFDIERHVSWDRQTLELHPFTHSMMIDAYYPASRLGRFGKVSHPTVEEFIAIAQSLDGFTADPNSGIQPEFKNSKKNLFINWSVLDPRRICIGVIQLDPVDDLQVITRVIVPDAVEIFNRLSPTYQITPELVARSVELAEAGALIMPQRRQ